MLIRDRVFTPVVHFFLLQIFTFPSLCRQVQPREGGHERDPLLDPEQQGGQRQRRHRVHQPRPQLQVRTEHRLHLWLLWTIAIV